MSKKKKVGQTWVVVYGHYAVGGPYTKDECEFLIEQAKTYPGTADTNPVMVQPSPEFMAEFRSILNGGRA